MKNNYFLVTFLLLLVSSCTTMERKKTWCSLEHCQALLKLKQSKAREPKQLCIVVVIDVFRAFSTAAYILDRSPTSYILAKKSDTVSRMAVKYKQPILIGKPEIGATLMYHIPNSPTRSLEIKVSGANVLHRTEAGAKGVLFARNADIVLVAGFVNAKATAEYIKKFPKARVILMPMGHEGTTPTLEDELCRLYIKGLINNKTINIQKFLPELKLGSGKYFFGKDQWQYPRSDFNLCLDIDHFHFPICADVKQDYAILAQCK